MSSTIKLRCRDNSGQDIFLVDSNTGIIGNSTSPSTNISTGALILQGGVSINKTSNSTSVTQGGALTISGGISIAKDTYIGGNLTVLGTSTSIISQIVNFQDNLLVVNNAPVGSKDAGILFQRYQIENNGGFGDIVNDNPIFLTNVINSTSNTIIFNTAASSSDDTYNNWFIKITSGIGINQVRQIISYVGNTRTATLNTAWNNQPSNGDTVQFFNKIYASQFYQESSDNFVFGYTSADPGASTVGISDYANLQTGSISIFNTNNAVGVGSGGSLNILGGASIQKKMYVGSDTIINNSVSIGNSLIVPSTYTTTGNIYNLINTNSTITNSLITNSTISNMILLNGNITNFTSSNGILTNATLTNLNLTNGTISTLYSSFINSTTNTLSNILNTNLTSNNIVVSNFNSTNNTLNNLSSTNITTGILISNNSFLTNVTATNLLLNNITNTNLLLTNGTCTNLLLTNITSANNILTNITSTNLIATNSLSTFNTNTNLLFSNASGTNAIITTISSNTILASGMTTASLNVSNNLVMNSSISNLIVTSNTVTNLRVDNINNTNQNVVNSTINNLISTNITINNTTNASSVGVGGTFTTFGGGSFSKDLYIGGTLYVNGQNSSNITGSVTIGNNSGTGVYNLSNISIGKDMVTTDYKIIGNLSSISNINNVYVVSFKNLTTTTFDAVIYRIDSLGSGWSDINLKLNWQILP